MNMAKNADFIEYEMINTNGVKQYWFIALYCYEPISILANSETENNDDNDYVIINN